jgi:hypothetical protein
MKKISTVHLKFFRNEEHYAYLIEFRNLILKFPAIQTIISIFYDSFISLLNEEMELINLMHKSDYTRQIVEAVRHVDCTLVGMRRIITAALHHFDPAIVEAAQPHYNRYNTFGNITRKTYEEKVAVVDILIGDFRSDKYAAKVSLIGLSPWLTELSTAASNVEQLLARRYTEYSQKPQESLRSIRHKMDILYHRIADRISAAATLENIPGTYDEFIAQLNSWVTYFNNHSHHNAPKNLGAAGACIVESIATQAYTGRPVTPLPTACYRKSGKPDVELIFTRDYIVTYRNNINPGMAVLILHGKGDYRGQKTITFSICDTNPA